MASLQNELICQCLSALSSDVVESQDYADAPGTLDKISLNLSRDESAREAVGLSLSDIWGKLNAAWDALSRRGVSSLIDNSLERNRTICIARFTRNLVAGNPHNQEEAYKFEPVIRAVAHTYTSHVFAVNKEEFSTTRFLMQTISNIVTSNEALLERLWATYLALPEEKNIFIRMITHPDDRTVVAALVLINNCVTGSRKRMRMLADTVIGRRLCVTLLDRIAKCTEDSDDKEKSDVFHLGWTIFVALFDNEISPSLINITNMEDEIVNPHQTTLLKLLDSYLLQLSTTNNPEGQGIASQFQGVEIFSPITTVLSIKFNELILNAQSSIKNSLGSINSTAFKDSANNGSKLSLVAERDTSSTVPLQSLDVLLPKVCEATVLMAQCFCTMTLDQDVQSNLSQRAQHVRQLLTNSTMSGGDGLIENLIALLRLLDVFLPRIMFGKATWSSPRPEGTLPTPPDKNEDIGFNYLKRDLVRLLGILCYENRAVQDRVRACDGITVVMNLCVTDERNPYLREHALFALRNLLHENVENQAVVDAIKPMGTWDENGVLRDAPGVRK